MKTAFWFVSLAQVALLAMQHPFNGQLLSGAILCAILISLLWQIRELLPAHADMFLIMTAFGGIGMVAGSYGQPTCHNSYAGTLGMLAASVPISLRYARCLQVPGRYWLVALDTIGMLTGMELMHRLATGADAWTMHVAMLAGMNLGMTIRLAIPAGVFAHFFPPAA